MEAKAKYTTVGAFVLGFIVFIAGFLIWISGGHLNQKTKALEIVFARVSGLKEGSPVRYQGLQVGSVASIRIDPKQPTRILVRVHIEDDAPIKTDVTASIELQGITGTSFIQLSGGTEQAPDIKFSKKEAPQIMGKASPLDNLIEGAPEVLNDFSGLAGDLRGVINHENQQAFSEILTNIRDITAAFKDSAAEDGGVAIKDSLTGLIQKAHKALDEIELAAKEIRGTVKENRESIKEFSSVGLTSLTKFLSASRDTMDAFKRVSESIERSPIRFLHNDSGRGVRLR